MNLKSRILVTGAAGFIGYHLIKSLLNDGYLVYGIDNLNDYYDPNLKNDRLGQLLSFENFKFDQIDITNNNSLLSAFKEFKPEKVVNLAAQAGVRYSLENPYAYVNTNIVGFSNLIELCRRYNVEGFIYASSSSVYGGNQKIPFSVDDRVDNPLSLYAATKKSNELIANSYSNLFGLHTTGLRYFTVYGPWGRPDMAMYIFTRKIYAGKPIQVFNHGKMKRDFTYIDDIVSGTRAAIQNNYPCEIFNLGNHRSENLMDVVGLIENNLGIKAEIDFLPMQPGDVPERFADISKTTEKLGFEPTVNTDQGVENFVNWYKEYHSVK